MRSACTNVAPVISIRDGIIAFMRRKRVSLTTTNIRAGVSIVVNTTNDLTLGHHSPLQLRTDNTY